MRASRRRGKSKFLPRARQSFPQGFALVVVTSCGRTCDTKQGVGCCLQQALSITVTRPKLGEPSTPPPEGRMATHFSGKQVKGGRRTYHEDKLWADLVAAVLIGTHRTLNFSSARGERARRWKRDLDRNYRGPERFSHRWRAGGH